MAALLAVTSADREEGRSHLLVSLERGVQRVEVERLAEDLWKWDRRTRHTRDSWVQTDAPARVVPAASAAEEETLQPLAPLASEEEFCSDTEQKQAQPSPDDGISEVVQHLEKLSVPPVVSQVSSIADLAEDVLMSQVAFMPGSKDRCGRSVIFVRLKQLLPSSSVQLAQLLLYFQSTIKRETMCLGFVIVVDGREAVDGGWNILHEAISHVEECIPGTISLILAWKKPTHKSERQTSVFPLSHIKYESIINWNQLLKYVAKDQLPVSFGGAFHYDHEEWINFHKLLDPFVDRCHRVLHHLVQLIQDLRNSQLPSTLSHCAIEQQKASISQALQDEGLLYLEREGPQFLRKIEEYRTRFPINADYQQASENGLTLYKQVNKVVQRLAELADERLKLQECMMMKVFEEESSQVLDWLYRKGEETLKKHKTLAKSLNAIRKQENEFERFYFVAMRQIERGNDLLEEIPKVRTVGGSSDQLRTQLNEFAGRLEDAREKLEDTSRCYQLLDKTYEWALEAMRFVSNMKVDATTSSTAVSAILRRLDSYLQAHPYLDEVEFEEMLQLATKLKNDSLLSQCETARTKYTETVKLIEARQETLRNAKEQMIRDKGDKHFFNENFDNVKAKPCLWNPTSTSTPYRTTSHAFLGDVSQLYSRKPAGSYTSFPSSYYPSAVAKEPNIVRRRIREDSFSESGIPTDDAFRRRTSLTDTALANLRDRPFLFSSDCLNVINKTSSPNEFRLNGERNWKNCEDALKKVTDEVREQNSLLQQRQMVVFPDDVDLKNRNWREGSSRPYSTSFAGSSLSTPNSEEFQKPAPVNSHLTRCASCSDFEELLSSKTSTKETPKANSRTLKLIMMEMIQTERDYVKSLGYIIENYVPLLQQHNINQALRCQRNVVFGNIEKIYEFHSCYFLKELEQCEAVPYSVGQCFLKYETQFYLYALYNKNKPKSDTLMAEYGNSIFKQKQQELGDKMDLASYLLKPVQRMGKYALLLKQLLKECPENNSEYYNNLKAAEEMVCFQLRHGNDLLAMDALRECDVNVKEQGLLLRQDEFLVWQGKSRKALRHVFLFEDLILFSKARRDPRCKGHDYYQYKHSMKTSDMGLTRQVGESPTKFEIWFRKRKSRDLYILQAPSAEVKNAWVEDITNLLWKQAERNRELRLEEMSSMGIGNKPCLDITPSQDQICDRSISLQQLNKVPRFRNSIAVSNSDNFNNNLNHHHHHSTSTGRSSSSSKRSTFYDTASPVPEVEEESEAEKRRSVTQQSQCSAESGIFTDPSMSGDSYSENVQRLKAVERSDSVLSRASCASMEAVNDIKQC